MMRKLSQFHHVTVAVWFSVVSFFRTIWNLPSHWVSSSPKDPSSPPLTTPQDRLFTTFLFIIGTLISWYGDFLSSWWVRGNGKCLGTKSQIPMSSKTSGYSITNMKTYVTISNIQNDSAWHHPLGFIKTRPRCAGFFVYGTGMHW